MQSRGQVPVYDPNDSPAPTIKQTNLHDARTGHMQSRGQVPVYDPNDTPAPTIKQTNLHDARTGHMQSRGQVPVYDPNDTPAPTIKQTNLHDTRTGNMQSRGQVPVYDPNDKPDSTIKDTNIHDIRTGYMNANTKEGIYDNYIAPTTTRETLADEPLGTNLQSNIANIVYDPNDIPATTIKDTNLHANWTGNLDKINDINQQARQTEYTAPNTHRQDTHSEYTGMADGYDEGGYKIASYSAPSTQKENLSNNEYSGNAQGSTKPRTIQDIMNMTTNIVREKIALGRQPTNTGAKISIGASEINYNNKKYEGHNMRDFATTYTYQKGPELSKNTITQFKHINHNPRSNNVILEQIMDNPYIIKPYSNQQI